MANTTCIYRSRFCVSLSLSALCVRCDICLAISFVFLAAASFGRVYKIRYWHFDNHFITHSKWPTISVCMPFKPATHGMCVCCTECTSHFVSRKLRKWPNVCIFPYIMPSTSPDWTTAVECHVSQKCRHGWNEFIA